MKKEISISDQVNTRISWIDTLKGLGIFLIVMGHVYWNGNTDKFLNSFHLSLFFFASGYTHKKRAVKKDFVQRFRKVIIPYFFFGILELIYWQTIEKKFRTSNLTFLQGLEGLLLGKYDLLEFNLHLWFLPNFFVCSLLLNILVTHKKSRRSLIICTFFFSAIYIFLPLPINGWPIWKNPSGWPGMPVLPWGIDKIPKYFFFMACGYLLRNRIGNQKVIASLNSSFSIFAAVTALIGIYFIEIFDIKQYRIFWYLSGTLGIVGTSVFSYRMRPLWLFQYLGRISLVILCIHGPIYRIICKLFSIALAIDTKFLRSNLFFAALIVFFTLILCSGVYEILSRLFPWSIGQTKGTTF